MRNTTTRTHFRRSIAGALVATVVAGLLAGPAGAKVIDATMIAAPSAQLHDDGEGWFPDLPKTYPSAQLHDDGEGWFPDLPKTYPSAQLHDDGEGWFPDLPRK